MTRNEIAIREAITKRDKYVLYEMRRFNRITSDDLLLAIIEIDESDTDWYKFKKRCRIRWSRCKVWWLFTKQRVKDWITSGWN